MNMNPGLSQIQLILRVPDKLAIRIRNTINSINGLVESKLDANDTIEELVENIDIKPVSSSILYSKYKLFTFKARTLLLLFILFI